jgi:hypothetical protein
MSKRYTLSEISGVVDSYAARPNGETPGQLVFALWACGGATCMGQCVPGIQLIPWGLCCVFQNSSSACSAASCTTCGFCLSTGTFVALGSVGGCGATLWRRIT